MEGRFAVPKDHYLDVALDAIKQYYPDARCAFLAGSIIRGEGKENSDIDIVVMYGDDFDDPHRHSVYYRDWIIEFFVHNEKAQDFLFACDVKEGVSPILHMVGYGKVLGPDVDYAINRQAYARVLWEKGPEPLSPEKIDRIRYGISSRIDDLRDDRRILERFGIISELYQDIILFYFRAKGKWGGHGKHLGRCIYSDNPDFSLRLESSFQKAVAGHVEDFAHLCLEVLIPYGGYLQAGYLSKMSSEWRDFKRESSEISM